MVQLLLLGSIAVVIGIWCLVLVPTLYSAATSGGFSAAVLTGVAVCLTCILPPLLDPAFYHGESQSALPLADLVWAPARGLLALILLLTLMLLVRGQLNPGPVAWSIATFWTATVLASMVNGQDPSTAVLMTAVVLFVGHLARSGADLLTIFRFLLRTITIGTVILWVLNPSSAYQIAGGEERTLFGIPQLAGLTSHPNVLGPVAAVAFITEISWFRARLFTFVGIAAAGACMVFAQSRGGWAAACIGLLVYWLARSTTRRQVWLRTVVLVLSGTPLVLSLFTASDSSGSDLSTGRFFIWQMLFPLVQDSLWIGHGSGVLSADNRKVLGSALIDAYVGQAHNQYLQTLLESGLFGIATLLLALILVLRTSLAREPISRAVSLGIVAALLVEMLVESPLRATISGFNIIVLLLVAIVSSRPKTTDDSSSSDKRPESIHRSPRPTRPAVPRVDISTAASYPAHRI